MREKTILAIPRRVPGAPALAIIVSSLLAVYIGVPRTSVAQTTDDNALQEIVVTAEKRNSTVQSTPISITAITGDQLNAAGISTVEEVAESTPGISMRTAGPGQTEYEMRGLASGGGSSPTVGFYLDETPLSPAAASINGRTEIDPDLYDLARVEVLRGPQGTLYGSGSMGGTIKLVTNQPVLNQFEGSVKAIFSGTDGGGFDRGGSGMVNLPIGGIVALRLVGTEKFTDGFIDRVIVNPFPFPTNPGTCPNWFGYGCTRGNVAAGPISQVIKHTNTELLNADRAILLVKPSDQLDLTTTLMYQGISAGGYNQFQIPPGAAVCLCIYQPDNLPEPITDYFRLASETINYDVGFAKLTSATSFWDRSSFQAQDSTESLQNLDLLPAFLPVYWTEIDNSRQLSEELRLTSSGAGDLQWVAGVFFSDLHSQYIAINQNPAYAPYSFGGASANPLGIILDSNNPYVIKQDAIFGDASYRFADVFKITAGLRWYKYNSAERYIEYGLNTQSGNATPIKGSSEQSAHGFNPKVTLSYEPTADLTLYGTVARGFRPGGVNLPVPTSGDVICPAESTTYGPDSVWSYEIGEKAKLIGDRIVINSDVYFIRWNNIQQNIELPCGYPYNANAGTAEAFGPEIEISARLLPGLTVNLSGAWTQSTITDANPATGITDGTRVLNVPKETGSLALIYDNPIGNLTWRSRIADSYVGNAADIAFYSTRLPPYNLLDFRTGVVAPKWSAYLFADNLGNKHAELTTNNTSISWNTPAVISATTNQPRTIGVDMQLKF